MFSINTRGLSPNLILLDLALFVAEPSSDVAATILVSNGSMKLFYCKNRPSTESENKYVRELFTRAWHTNPDRTEDLGTTVVNQCQKKIKARMSKASRRAKELQPTADPGILSEGRLNPQLVTRLRAQLGIDSGLSIKGAIISWCKNVNSPDVTRALTP